MHTDNIYYNTPENREEFMRIMNAPNQDKPIVEMNETTSKNIEIIWKSIEALAAYWRGNQPIRMLNMHMDRKAFWGLDFAKNDNELLPLAKEYIDNTSGVGKVAIDLGSGNSPASDVLLKKGWRVIAVDYSKQALAVLAVKHKVYLSTGQLVLVEADITEYTPDQPVDLVIAADSFPYVDPSKFKATWEKVHAIFLKQNGTLVGSLFRAFTKPELAQELNVWKEMGAWFLPDRRMVKALLAQTGYEIKSCSYRSDPGYIEPACIQFIAEKKN